VLWVMSLCMMRWLCKEREKESSWMDEMEVGMGMGCVWGVDG
jgi:hypothetical protein